MHTLRQIPQCILATALLLTACQGIESGDDDDDGSIPQDVEIVAQGTVFSLTVGEDTIASLPERGPVVDPDAAELGWLLFWDPVLSGAGDVACATCHLPEWGYADGLPTSIGVGGSGRGPARSTHPAGRVGRNAPGILNTVFNGIEDDGSYSPEHAPMFWDNRASGFVEQALGPVRSDVEMRGDAFAEDEIWNEVARRLNEIPEYRNRFDQVFGEPASSDTVTRAIGAFESTLVANNAPFDRWMRGDESALSQQQIDGLVSFFEADCVACHSGPMFSDFETHVLAAPDGAWLTSVDEGDGEFGFRTPSLRQLEYTAPYFHGGHAADLETAIEFYDLFEGDDDDDGGDDDDDDDGDGDADDGANALNPGVPLGLLDEDLDELDLEGDEVEDIAAFLESLNDPNFFMDEPSSVPSGLPVGGFQ